MSMTDKNGGAASGHGSPRMGAGGGFQESAAMSALLAQNWWAIALRGAAGIVFGLIALFMPGVTIGVLVLWFAAYMLVDGIFGIVAGVRAARRNERWGGLILEGIVDLIAGAIAFLIPAATVLAFVYLSAGWAVISGALMLAAVFRLRPTHGKWFLALGGVVSVLWGILLFLAPIPGAVVMTWWLGAYALVFGAALLVLGFRLRAHRHEATGAPAPA
ncbi:MAG TPA: HdeD family acid-resistance protein [Azospirillum sp.]|nr:HdeD family acid-resistance protein [Azospirillum sp.]